MRRRRPSAFMAGRNGTDALSMAESFSACVLLILAMIFSGVVGQIFWLLALVLLVLSYMRIFSRNLAKRQAENQRFLMRMAPIRRKIQLHRQRKRQKNLYCFFKCPQCSTVLRVPKGKGHIRITCRSCGHVFERNS